MKTKILIACFMLIMANSVFAQKQLSKEERIRWWNEAKFGMFIHWGISSVWAGNYKGKEIRGHSEWIMHGDKIPMTEYQKLLPLFNPKAFNAEEWVRVAKEAGMKYIVFTSKHHDGIAMFKSEASPLNIVDATPFGRDVVEELAAACKKYDMKFGLYYSQAQDWNHPGGAASGGIWDPAQKGDMDAYLDKVAVPQVREILTKYGPIAELWWDTPNDMTKERAAKFLPLLNLQPDMITNDRLGGGIPGDIETPEQYIPATGIPGKNWESCITMNDSWGYRSTDNHWKSSKTLIRNLIDITSKGGNLLLNIGPMSDGTIPQASLERLKDFGEWLKQNGEAIYGTQASPFPYLSWGKATRKENKLYLHVFDWPTDGTLRVPLKNSVNKAYLLANPQKKLSYYTPNKSLVLQVPEAPLDTIATVIVLEISGEPNVVPIPSLHRQALASSEESVVQHAANAFDGNPTTYWKVAKGKDSGWIQVTLDKPTKIGAVGMQEGGPFEKVIQKYKLEYLEDNAWKILLEGNTIGPGFVRSFKPVVAKTVRLTILKAEKQPGIKDIFLFPTE